MAGLAQPAGQLAHDLYAHEPLEQGGRAQPDLCATATGANHPAPNRGGFLGQHHRQSPPRRHRGFKKNGPQAIGKSHGGWTTKIHLVAANARCALSLCLTPGQAADAPEARALLLAMGPAPAGCHLIMDRAYEGDAMRQLALDLGFVPVVPPRTTRLSPWNYNRILYRRRNEIERLFRRLKGFRRIFSRFDKLDLMFTNFILFALIVEALR